MALNSMTGFARGGGEANGYRWNWEIKSVNNKGLDVRTRFPSFLDGFDLAIKKVVGKSLTRGSIFINLTVDNDNDEGTLVINEPRLQSLLAIAAKYQNCEGVAPATLDGLLAVKGVVELALTDHTEDSLAALQSALTNSLNQVLADLKTARADEGARMQAFLEGQLAEVEALAVAAREHAGDRLEAMYTRFKDQLAKLSKIEKPVSDERIAQELATMTVKADIQEELDRLDSHVEEAKLLLASRKPVGRRLDFLCQEFNREANTLCSKSSDTTLTKIGLDLKVLVDQFREQVQNIE